MFLIASQQVLFKYPSGMKEVKWEAYRVCWCAEAAWGLACWFLASVSLQLPCRWWWGSPPHGMGHGGSPARGTGHVGAAELEGVGMVNQQMLLTASVPWAFLPAPPLLWINLEQRCAVCHDFAQKEELVIALNRSGKQQGTMAIVFYFPASQS